MTQDMLECYEMALNGSVHLDVTLRHKSAVLIRRERDKSRDRERERVLFWIVLEYCTALTIWTAFTCTILHPFQSFSFLTF